MSQYYDNAYDITLNLLSFSNWSKSFISEKYMYLCKNTPTNYNALSQCSAILILCKHQ